MLKHTRFYIGLTLLVQAVICIFLVILFLYKNKRSIAATFTALGLAGGIAGAILIAKQIREQYEEDKILGSINDLCYEDDDFNSNIPVDETASESEFN